MQPKSILHAAWVGSYPLAFLYINNILSAGTKNGVSVLVFVLCFLLAGEALAWALECSESRCTSYPREAIFWAICAIGIALAFVLHDQFGIMRPLFWDWNRGRGLILFYGELCLHLIAAYWVVCRFGWLCRGKTGGWLVVDACNALVFFPFGSFFLRVKLFWQGVYHLCKRHLSAKIEKKPAAITAIILGVFCLFFSAALGLLRQSDAVFAAFLSQFHFDFTLTFSFEWNEFWVKLLLSLPVGAYFFGLFSRCMQLRQAPSAFERELAAPLRAAHQLRVVSPRALTAVLCCFIGLYLLYFGVQAEYYLSAFWGDLPAAFTFSEYARKGFFELCKLMALNFALLFCVAKVSKTPLRQHKGLRIAGYGLLITSLFFAATALAKLVLYIDAYGFTDLRLLSAWGISVLVVAVVLAMQTMHHAQPVVAKLTYFAAGSFTLLCLLAT